MNLLPLSTNVTTSTVQQLQKIQNDLYQYQVITDPERYRNENVQNAIDASIINQEAIEYYNLENTDLYDFSII